MGTKAVFKSYRQHQVVLLPPSLEELIPPKHLVRVISTAIDEMDLRGLMGQYRGGGASRYHPVMLLKVLVYCYTQKIFTSRPIEKAIHENVYCMWLAGGNRPDHQTISRFRSERLKEVLEKVLAAMAEMLLGAGLIRLEDCFVDGTKIEANANKYSFVWKTSVKKNKAKLQKKVKDLFKQIEELQEQEDRAYGERSLEEMGEESTLTPAKIRERMQKLNEDLRKHPPQEKKTSRAIQKACQTVEEDCLPRLKRYERQERILGKRNSFSKTDQEATFMRMKDDHMRNGQLKPGYNVQIATERRYVLHVRLHPHATDTSTLKKHLAGLKRVTGRHPQRAIADAGYGSLENYEYLKRNKIAAFVKYNTFDKESTRAYRKNRFDPERFPYDATHDRYRCPADKPMAYVGSETQRTSTGYRTTYRVYEAESCTDCPLRTECHRSTFNRRIRVNEALRQHKAAVRERLNSPLGLELRRRRLIEPETVCAQTKHNLGFKRFFLRGTNKATTEYGLVALAHNMINLANDLRRSQNVN